MQSQSSLLLIKWRKVQKKSKKLKEELTITILVLQSYRQGLSYQGYFVRLYVYYLDQSPILANLIIWSWQRQKEVEENFKVSSKYTQLLKRRLQCQKKFQNTWGIPETKQSA